MKVYKTEPTEQGYYWWLPEFLAHEPKITSHWTIQFFSPETNFGRVGYFVGPITPPTDVDLTNAE